MTNSVSSGSLAGLKSRPAVAVVGMGIEGTSLARYFLKQGADVVVHHWMKLEDLKKDPQLGPQYEALSAAGATFKTGKAYLTSLTSCDIVGVVQSAFTYRYPENQVALREVQELGIPIVTNLSIFLDLCPARIIGITGTNGKTTTTEMTVQILNMPSGRHLPDGERRIWAGGNLGMSPLDVVEEIAPEDLVVLELSNYQLEFLSRSPWIAAITNIAPDHLVDYGGDYRAYKAAKRRILDFQTTENWAVLNADDPVTQAWLVVCQAQPFPFSRQKALDQGAFVRQGVILVRRGEQKMAICRADSLKVRGAHNLENALCATAIGVLAGVSSPDISAALSQYQAGEHRLEFVGEWNGIQFYNDSKSTTPSSTVAAIRAFPGQPLILLAGGQDKGLPWEEFAREVQRSVKELIVFGEAQDIIRQAVVQAGAASFRSLGRRPVIKAVLGLDEAIEMALRDACPGDVVLLSPACASFDEFGSYADRGRHFKQLVRAAFEEIDGGSNGSAMV